VRPNVARQATAQGGAGSIGLPMDVTPERDARAAKSAVALRAYTVASPQAEPLLRAPARSWTSEDKVKQRLRSVGTRDDARRKTLVRASVAQATRYKGIV